jgi:hypothetical protein
MAHGIAIGRTPTTRVAVDLPSLFRELVAPYVELLAALEWRKGDPVEPSVQAILDAYPALIGLVETEVAAYVATYASRCELLEDELASARMQLARRAL